MPVTTEPRSAQRERVQVLDQPATDLIGALKLYARENPESAALWCVAIGFILGWKLKPW